VRRACLALMLAAVLRSLLSYESSALLSTRLSTQLRTFERHQTERWMAFEARVLEALADMAALLTSRDGRQAGGKEGTVEAGSGIDHGINQQALEWQTVALDARASSPGGRWIEAMCGRYGLHWPSPGTPGECAASVPRLARGAMAVRPQGASDLAARQVPAPERGQQLGLPPAPTFVAPIRGCNARSSRTIAVPPRALAARPLRSSHGSDHQHAGTAVRGNSSAACRNPACTSFGKGDVRAGQAEGGNGGMAGKGEQPAHTSSGCGTALPSCDVLGSPSRVVRQSGSLEGRGAGLAAPMSPITTRKRCTPCSHKCEGGSKRRRSQQ
jgi:hypothetical protein